MSSFVVNHGIIASLWKHLIHMEGSHTFGKHKLISKYCLQNLHCTIHTTFLCFTEKGQVNNERATFPPGK